MTADYWDIKIRIKSFETLRSHPDALFPLKGCKHMLGTKYPFFHNLMRLHVLYRTAKTAGLHLVPIKSYQKNTYGSSILKWVLVRSLVVKTAYPTGSKKARN